MSKTDLSPAVAEAPSTTVVEAGSSGSSVLPWVALAAGGYFLLKDSDILGGVGKAADGIGTAVGAAGDLIADAAHMIGLTLTWPDKLYQYIRFPEKEKAKMLYEELFPKLIEGCQSGALSEASLFLGYDPALACLRPPRAPFDIGYQWGSYREDLGHVIPRSPKQIAAVNGYMSGGEWAQAQFCSIHSKEPVVVVDGFLYAIDPRLNYILDIFRYGQSQDGGFNVWPDGSSGHPREGFIEGWLLTAILRSLTPGIPVGFTQGILLAYSARYFCQHLEPPGAPPVCPVGTDFGVDFMARGFFMKTLWPMSSSGFTRDSRNMPRRCDEGVLGNPACCIGWLQDNGRMWVPDNCDIPDSRTFYLTVQPYGPDAVPGDSRDMRSVDLAIQIDGRNDMSEKPDLDLVTQLGRIIPNEERYLRFPVAPPDWYWRLADAFGTRQQVQAAIDIATQ